MTSELSHRKQPRVKKYFFIGLAVLGVILVTVGVRNGSRSTTQIDSLDDEPLRTSLAIPEATSTPPLVAVKSWNTFKNEAYGFELQYPNNLARWTGEDRDDFVSFADFHPSTGAKLVLDISALTDEEDTTRAAFLEKESEFPAGILDVVKQELQTVQGYDALKRVEFATDSQITYVSAYIFKDGVVYVLVLTGTKSTPSHDLEQLFDAIFATFKFLPQ